MTNYFRRIGWTGAIQAAALLVLLYVTRHPDLDRQVALAICISLLVVFLVLLAIRLVQWRACDVR